MPAVLPISTQALTMGDHAMRSNNPRVQMITKCFLSTQNVLNYVPMVNSPDLKKRGSRIDASNLPPTGWGAVNQKPTDVKTTTKSYESSAFFIREKVQVDTILLKQKDWVEDPIETESTGALNGIRYDMNLAFLYNNPDLDQNSDTTNPYNVNGGPLAPAGLRYIIQHPSDYSLPVNGDGSSQLDLPANPGGFVNLMPNLTTTDSDNLLEALGTAFAFLGADEGDQCVCFTNYKTKLRLERGIRRQGGGAGFDTSKDAFGRTISQFQNCKIVDLGFYRDNPRAPIVSATLDANGNETGTIGANNYTELYIVRFGKGFLNGWQSGSMDLEDLGRSTEYGTYHNFLIDWMGGMTMSNFRSFVRLSGFKLS